MGCAVSPAGRWRETRQVALRIRYPKLCTQAHHPPNRSFQRASQAPPRGLPEASLSGALEQGLLGTRPKILPRNFLKPLPEAFLRLLCWHSQGKGPWSPGFLGTSPKISQGSLNFLPRPSEGPLEASWAFQARKRQTG